MASGYRRTLAGSKPAAVAEMDKTAVAVPVQARPMRNSSGCAWTTGFLPMGSGRVSHRGQVEDRGSSFPSERHAMPLSPIASKKYGLQHFFWQGAGRLETGAWHQGQERSAQESIAGREKVCPFCSCKVPFCLAFRLSCALRGKSFCPSVFLFFFLSDWPAVRPFLYVQAVPVLQKFCARHKACT